MNTDKNLITKVICTEKVDGKVLAMSRLNRYADAFVIGEGVNRKNVIFNPTIHNAKVVIGISKAMRAWRELICKITST